MFHALYYKVLHLLSLSYIAVREVKSPTSLVEKGWTEVLLYASPFMLMRPFSECVESRTFLLPVKELRVGVVNGEK